MSDAWCLPVASPACLQVDAYSNNCLSTTGFGIDNGVVDRGPKTAG